jgi:drug/metabolite transporter (DMT)-like permease
MIIIIFLLPFSFLGFMIESWKDFFSLIAHPYLLLMLVGMVVADIIQVTLWSYAYANEKISILTPYEQISPILGIVLGFFLFT